MAVSAFARRTSTGDHLSCVPRGDASPVRTFLGVMELAGRVYDIVTNHIHPRVREELGEITDPIALAYWRRVIRLAALCHDLGHLPFSHAAEKELLPDGWNHEKLTAEICRSSQMNNIWEGLAAPVRVEDIIKLAVGPKKLPNVAFSSWEAILAEIITGDAFGVDRIDYLLRDSHHAGVAYGKFDHFRLIDTLRILPWPDEGDGGREGPTLGIQEGGLHSAEALLVWSRECTPGCLYRKEFGFGFPSTTK